MSDFANLRDGGRQLGAALAARFAGATDAVLLPALPNGVPVVVGIRELVDLPVIPLPVDRSGSAVVVLPVPGLSGRTAVVIDDAVETGTVARAAVRPLRDSGVARLVLAVPVCPRAVLTDLAGLYDDVVAVVVPETRLSLTEHFADFDTVDEAEARRLLASLPA